ncbi:MAG TPA: monovalent cation/H+ antiporter subunit D [Usitatibacter sp.]|nr:monovalent cation/H+ antiporter subunit D [Usitatibacter sp.]
MSGMPHLVIAPVLLPMAAAAVMLLMGGASRAKAAVSVLAAAAGLAVAVALCTRTIAGEGTDAIGVYLPSNWDVPFGIVLVVDRLSAFMLVIAAIVGLAAIVFSVARWDRAGPHFHSLAQLQLMGLNGAFLTADVFNLFVFFEIALAASYALLFHGSGRARVGAGLHYLAINLLASSFFLIGVAVLYGITGTLNMADIAAKLPQVPQADRGLLHAGAAILGLAFLAKAAMWPLNSWLAPAYTGAAPPVAALFVLLTKLGIYAALRTWSLLVSTEPGETEAFGGTALAYGGLATIAFGSLAMLGVQQLRRLAAYAVIVSSGTLLAAIGFAHAALAGAALLYLAVSTLGTAALFLLAELVERSRTGAPASIMFDEEADTRPIYVAALDPRGELPSTDEVPVGRAIPGTMAFLGLSFMACALLVAGLPPLSGFLAKFALLAALLEAPLPAMRAAGWTFFTFLIASGLLSTVVLSRAGIRYFWAPQGRSAPAVRWVEGIPIGALLAAAIALTVFAEPVLEYGRAAASSLFAPTSYVEAVLSARPVP